MKKRTTAATRLGALLVATALVGQLSGSVVRSAASSAREPAPLAERSRCSLPGPYDYPRGDDPVDLHPRDFTARIDHPYFPMRPGTVWKYRETDGEEVQRVRVTVTRRTRMIEGIRARVVHDVVRSGGELVENTFDWYAQDSGGSIWYLGEATKEFEDGEVVSTEGSWEHGRDGAQAGLLLPARPRHGCGYREEHLAGVAEDRAAVIARREAVKVPNGFYRRVLHTTNWTPLEPDILENKLYARGVGPVVEVDLSPRFSRSVLRSVTHR